MPPQRLPLGVIPGNRLRNCELHPYTRGQITGPYILGFSPAAIVLGLNQPLGTVWSTIARDEARCLGETKARPGRLLEYTIRDERKIVRHVRLFPKYTYTQVISELGLTIKTTTIKKILRIYGITNWRVKRRPTLTEAYAAIRLL